jgi:hypothetical protein
MFLKKGDETVKHIKEIGSSNKRQDFLYDFAWATRATIALNFELIYSYRFRFKEKSNADA